MAALDVSGMEDSSCGKDGPVLTMMNKRLRALKKKYNRIVQLEDAKEKGKAINKEQEDVLKSKVQVLALIEEYDRLRQPLLVAVREEIAEKEKEWIAAKEEQVCSEDKDGLASNESLEEARTESEEASNENLENAGGGDAENVGGGGGDPAIASAAATPAAATEDQIEKIKAPVDSNSGSVAGLDENLMLELIQLLYFALLFDVKSQGEAYSFMRTIKYHERVSCLSYDLVTDDSTSHLTDADLDALAAFGSLVTSRSPNTTLSHRDALQACIAHARHWLLNSNAIIDANVLNVTYTDLRERLNRILATEYFTMTPELQTVTSEIAVGQFGAELGVPQEHYVNGDAPTSVGNVSDSSGTNSEAFQLEVNPNKSLPREDTQPAEDQRQPDETNPRQHQPQQGFQQKFRGNRGGGGGNVGGGGGGATYGRGRGRGGGRGYRGGGGGYPPSNGNRGGGNAGNGGGQYYDQSGYYQRNSYYGSGNRRGRGYYNNSSSNNNAPSHANGPSPAVES